MIESATGTTFAAQKQESPDAKVSCPYGLNSLSTEAQQGFSLGTIICCSIPVNTPKLQTVPKQEGAMNTQSRRHDIYSSQVYRCASLLNEFKP